MKPDLLFETVGNVDIYIIDQILKGRYNPGESILDAGCGEGRNLKWFYHNNCNITGIDIDEKRIKIAKEKYPKAAHNLFTGSLESLPFNNDIFDHVICCAVLHFAKDETHFNTMLGQMVRVLKPGGSLLIRVASNIGLGNKQPFVQDSVNHEVSKFYVTRKQIVSITKNDPLQYIEPVKTTNVEDKRAMTTLVFRKKSL